jgi:chromosome segregation ATPase
LNQLESALNRVEDAVDRRLEHAGRVADLENELQQLGTDRSRLAQSLDAAEARSGRIEEANREVSGRLVTAMESIRGVLERNGAG